MKNCFKVALAALALTGFGSAARADLTIGGAVGLPLNPTAQIPQQGGGTRVQGNYFKLGNNINNYGIVAATRVGDKLEVNGGYDRVSGNGDSTNGIAIGAKYLFSRETDPVGVRFAVGGGYNRALARQTYAYGVATKYLGEVTGEKVPISAHLGLRYDRFSEIDSNKVSVFAGVEVPVTQTGDIQVVGEIQSKNAEGGTTPYSASVRYRPKGQPFGASLGYARQGLTSNGGVFAQIGYTFGG
ncbi:hypothetical protein B1R32_12012 [Abditibacterium utsteinense]|uniref:Outer membrane protein beta-barrel domain-containing protein n=1 Tax=Abditibacterium utsteinense TaxID=1960156 RepID=A0A2S8SPZ4_9BACT|nr:hypothetical protein [Abditibacterium utsteinense]PQV62839.1 hypothetical protein B1R32_12012 [Abditibacterium utsteinense]